MGKYIIPYISSLINNVSINEDDANVIPIERKKDPYYDLVDQSKQGELIASGKARLESMLMRELDNYWDNKKKFESAIDAAKKKLDDNHKRMLEVFDSAISELENLDIRITNGQLKLDKLIIYMSEPERMHEFSDDAKLFVYKIMKESYKKQTEACEEFLRATGAITDVMEFREFGLSYDKEKDGGRYKEHSFWHEKKIESDSPDVHESVNEGVFDKISNMIKDVWKRVRMGILRTKDKVKSFEESLDILEKAINSK